MIVEPFHTSGNSRLPCSAASTTARPGRYRAQFGYSDDSSENGGTRTIDGLDDLLHNVNHRLLTEALFRAVEQNRVDHEIIEFRPARGGFSRARGYFLPLEPAQAR